MKKIILFTVSLLTLWGLGGFLQNNNNYEKLNKQNCIAQHHRAVLIPPLGVRGLPAGLRGLVPQVGVRGRPWWERGLVRSSKRV
jgi:hypothetical protein